MGVASMIVLVDDLVGEPWDDPSSMPYTGFNGYLAAWSMILA